MKRFIVALVFVGGIGAVAFASLDSGSRKAKDKQEVKKVDKEKKKDCKHTCPFS